MKKLTLLALMISLFQVINAQERFVLGGSMNFLTQNDTYPLSSLSINSGIGGNAGVGGFYSNSTNDSRNTTFGVSTYLGKAVSYHLLLGLQFGYVTTKYTIEDALVLGQPTGIDFESNSDQIGFGVFGRYTVNPENRFNFYLQPYLGYNLLNEQVLEDSNIAQEEKAKFLELGVGAGLLYNLNHRMRATLRVGGLNYVNGTWEIVDTDTEKDFSSFGMNLNLSTIFFGIELKL